MKAKKLDEIMPRLIPVTLKFYNDERGYAFLIDARGTEIFAHISTLRIAYRDDRRLLTAEHMTITDEGFGHDPELYCIVGPGEKPGQVAAVVWVGTDISGE